MKSFLFSRFSVARESCFAFSKLILLIGCIPTSGIHAQTPPPSLIVNETFEKLVNGDDIPDGTEIDFDPTQLPGWSVRFGQAIVKVQPGGNRCLCLKGGTNPSVEVERTVPAPVATSDIFWIRFRIKPVVEVGDLQESSLEVNGSVISFTRVTGDPGTNLNPTQSGAFGGIRVLDGDQWLDTKVGPPVTGWISPFVKTLCQILGISG